MVLFAQTKDNRLVQSFMALEPKLKDMDEKYTQSQIEEQAQTVTAEELGKDPNPLAGSYVVVDGAVSAEETDAVDLNIARNVFSDTEYKGYILDQSIVMIDITGTGADYPEGTILRGYGVVLIVNIDDIWKLPIVGPNLKKEFDGVKGMSDRVTFFFTKGVKVLTPVSPATKKEAAAKPEDKAATPAEGDAAKPAEGATTPPAAGEAVTPK